MKFDVVKMASTGNGWGISLHKNYNWQTGEVANYSVNRFNDENKFVMLSFHKNIAKAKESANREWAADVRAKKAQGKI